MDLLPQDIKDFKRLYKAKFGITLSDRMAKPMLLILVKQIHETYQPITKHELDELYAVKKDVNEDDQHGKTRTTGNR